LTREGSRSSVISSLGVATSATNRVPRKGIMQKAERKTLLTYSEYPVGQKEAKLRGCLSKEVNPEGLSLTISLGLWGQGG